MVPNRGIREDGILTGLPRHHPVELKLMPPEGGPVRTIVSLYGGQGAINGPCWAPDGSRFAYIRYDRFDPATG